MKNEAASRKSDDCRREGPGVMITSAVSLGERGLEASTYEAVTLSQPTAPSLHKGFV